MSENIDWTAELEKEFFQPKPGRLTTVEGVTEEELTEFDPSRYDARKQDDGTYTLVPLLWWDEASYATYQGDSE